MPPPDRVEVAGDYLAPLDDPHPARNDREEPLESLAVLEKMIGNGELVDQPARDLGAVLRRVGLKRHDIMVVPPAPARAALEVAGDAGTCVEYRAQAIAVCTNTPIVDRFAIHTKQAPYRTFAIAARVPRGALPHVLLWDTENPYHYVRLAGGTTQREKNARVLLIRRDGTFVEDSRAVPEPGDEIMVLPRVGSRNVEVARGITQILYQIAIAAKVVLDL